MSYTRRARAHMATGLGEVGGYQQTLRPMFRSTRPGKLHGLGDESVYQVVRAAADKARGLSVTPINPNLTVTPIVNPNLTVTPISRVLRPTQRWGRPGVMHGLGDIGAYSWSPGALAAAHGSGYPLSVVTMTTQNNFSVVPISSTAQYDTYKQQADAGIYSYVALYENGTFAEEYSTGVVVAESWFDKLDSPWVLAAVGGALLVAVWSTREKKKRKHARRGY